MFSEWIETYFLPRSITICSSQRFIFLYKQQHFVSLKRGVNTEWINKVVNKISLECFFFSFISFSFTKSQILVSCKIQQNKTFIEKNKGHVFPPILEIHYKMFSVTAILNDISENNFPRNLHQVWYQYLFTLSRSMHKILK